MKFTPDTDDIARLAYAIWEQEGRPLGRDQQHWLEAERLLTATPVKLPPRPLSTTPTRLSAGRSSSARASVLVN